MITDSRAFEERTVPEDLHSRSGELTALANALDPTREETVGEPMPAFIFGPSGAGKTVSAKFMARRLSSEGVRTAYVNCWRAYRRADFLEAVFDGLGAQRAQYHRSLPASESLARLRRALDGYYVVVVDEADVLDDTETLQQVASVPEIVPVVIANREDDLFNRFDGSYGDLRSGVRVRFERYPPDALVDILKARAEHGLEPGVWNQDLLAYVADAAAGNARLAIQTLGTAAERCTDRELHEEHVDNAKPVARARIKRRAFSSLDADMRTLIKIIAEADDGEIGPGDLYAAFEERVSDPPSRRTIRNWLDDLSHYNLIERRGQTRGRRYALDSVLRESLFADGAPEIA